MANFCDLETLKEHEGNVVGTWNDFDEYNVIAEFVCPACGNKMPWTPSSLAHFTNPRCTQCRDKLLFRLTGGMIIVTQNDATVMSDIIETKIKDSYSALILNEEQIVSMVKAEFRCANHPNEKEELTFDGAGTQIVCDTCEKDMELTRMHLTIPTNSSTRC